MIALVEITCKKCGEKRKVMAETRRAKEEICGECWDWNLPLNRNI